MCTCVIVRVLDFLLMMVCKLLFLMILNIKIVVFCNYRHTSILGRLTFPSSQWLWLRRIITRSYLKLVPVIIFQLVCYFEIVYVLMINLCSLDIFPLSLSLSLSLQGLLWTQKLCTQGTMISTCVLKQGFP